MWFENGQGPEIFVQETNDFVDNFDTGQGCTNVCPPLITFRVLAT